MNYCLIPAKGYSSRLKDKNIKRFFGKPIIAYPYQEAVKSNVFDEIDVFTDDTKIQTLVKTKLKKANTLQENKKDSHINRTLSDVVIDYIKTKNLKQGYIGILLPTSVFIKHKDIIEISKYKKKHTVVACKPISKKTFNSYVNGKRLYKAYKNIISQNLPTPYVDAGQFYWINIDSFIKNPIILSEKIITYPLSQKSIDIDTKEDFTKAKKLYLSLFGNFIQFLYYFF